MPTKITNCERNSFMEYMFVSFGCSGSHQLEDAIPSEQSSPVANCSSEITGESWQGTSLAESLSPVANDSPKIPEASW